MVFAVLLWSPISIVEIRRKKSRLVLHVVTVAQGSVWGKEEIEASLEVGYSAGYLDKTANVLSNVKEYVHVVAS